MRCRFRRIVVTIGTDPVTGAADDLGRASEKWISPVFKSHATYMGRKQYD
jgi:hypothetical protein